MAALLVGFAGEDLGADQRLAGKLFREVVLEPAREVEARLFRRLALRRDQALGAGPADLDAAEEVGLRARHAEQAIGIECRLRAENLRIGMETDLGAAAIVHVARGFQLRGRLSARESLAIELPVARNLDLEMIGERVHDRYADAMQAARRLIDLRVEFSASVQRRHNDFERRLVLEFRVRVDRDAAAVVGDSQPAVLVEIDLDPVGMAGDGLVH